MTESRTIADGDSAPSLLMPRKPTISRYWRLFLNRGGVSLLRALEYEALAGVKFEGRILDYGGGENAHYLPLLRRWMRGGSYESVNISASMMPTYLVRPDEALSLPEASYDMVLAINTLEHIFCIQSTIAQLIQLLCPGGRVVFCTPFLYRMHGSPHDYNRPTAQWWALELQRQGLVGIQIEPLMWDAFSAGHGVSEGIGPLRTLRRLVVPLYGLLHGLVRGGTEKERYPNSIGTQIMNFALGYLVQAIKGPIVSIQSMMQPGK